MRYTIGIGKGDDKYDVIDSYTGTKVAEDVSAESADGRCEQKNKDYEEAQEAVRKLTSFVNRGGAPKDFVDALYQEHRTLQQGVGRCMVAWIDHLASLEDGHYDLRNEGSVMLAKQIVQTPFWEQKKYLPFI
jgi:hypothetical protein